MAKRKINKAIIFGGMGFIGRNLAAKLIENHFAVEVVDKNITAEQIKKSQDVENITLIPGDILDRKFVNKNLKDNSVVFNLAGHSGASISLEEPFLNIDINILGSLNILEAARTRTNIKVVYMGSRLEYGSVKKLPVSEDTSIDPNSLYGVTKFTAGQYHVLYKNIYNLDTLVFRGTNPYGPTMFNSNSGYNIISNMINMASHQSDINIYKESANTTKDYIYIGDFCNAMMKGALSKKATGKVINLGSGKGITLLKAAQIIVKTLGTGKIKIVKSPSGFMKTNSGDFVADIKLAKQIISWTPEFSFENGVRETINSVKDKNSNLYKILSI